MEYRTRIPGGKIQVVRFKDGWKKEVSYEDPKKEKGKKKKK